MEDHVRDFFQFGTPNQLWCNSYTDQWPYTPVLSILLTSLATEEINHEATDRTSKLESNE